jgi:transposase
MAGEIVLLSQDEARFPMVPTLTRTLGVKGHRPTIGTWDNKGLCYVFASVNTVDGKLSTRTLKCPAAMKRKTGMSKTRHLQIAFAKHLDDIGRTYPERPVVLIIDNAPWHRGRLIDEALKRNPHIQFKRLPSYSPQLNVIERFWRLLRRRATHNRLFDTLEDLQRSIRHSISYFQTVKRRIRSLLLECYASP